LDEQWYDDSYWSKSFNQQEMWDDMITEFNEKTGLAKQYS
jgi:hypothetical protein